MMCCGIKNMAVNSGSGRKKSVIRFIALAIFVCIVTTSLLSSASILTHADHEHDHNGPNNTCATCAQIAAAENILKRLSTALAVAAIAIVDTFALIAQLRADSPQQVFTTLVGLKVRLNN
ncbi:MAG: hypothetical protein LBD02_10175 [Christensenellaceae bacterium]|jgi:hypothetical protein|nr:hypothetical protein [Christensenellaceae bacterium]